VRVFTSFDFDHDADLRTLLVGQAKHPDTPFELADWSLQDPLTGDWRTKIARRIRSVDQMIVLCGWYTHTATGVNVELRIAQEEDIPYFLLAGRADGNNMKPTAARATDKMYKWSWENLKSLIAGGR
jgi:hypothetical protein